MKLFAATPLILSLWGFAIRGGAALKFRGCLLSFMSEDVLLMMVMVFFLLVGLLTG